MKKYMLVLGSLLLASSPLVAKEKEKAPEGKLVYCQQVFYLPKADYDKGKQDNPKSILMCQANPAWDAQVLEKEKAAEKAAKEHKK